MGEWIRFNWTTQGTFYKGQICFGDGNITALSSVGANSSIIHKYATEGRYNVTIYGRTSNDQFASEHSDWVVVEIKNSPPQFDISVAKVGDYPGTYSFENNSNGSQTTDWTVSESPGCSISVKSFLGAHNKVVQMYDNNENEGFKMTNYFSEVQSGGTIDFWVRGDSASTYDYLYMELWGSSRTCQVQWRLSEHKLYVFDGDWQSYYDASILKDKWFHMKVVFDKSANTIRWYCDGVYLGTTNYENGVNIDHIVFFSAWWTSNADFTWYLDAIGYSWDLNYSIGDNLDIVDNSYNEDDLFHISVTNLVESNHDLKPGILHYEYDFADGNKTTSNSTSISHSWENTGTYNIIVTAIDDQNAVSQSSNEIEIKNRAPKANFSFSIDSASNDTISSYMGTYDFRNDIIGEEPQDWDVYYSETPIIDTAVLRPNGDVETNWATDPSNLPDYHYQFIDETGDPDGNVLYYCDWSDDTSEIFDMESIDLQNGTITKVTLYAYGKIIRDPYGSFPFIISYPNDDFEVYQPKSNVYFGPDWYWDGKEMEREGGGWREEKTWNFHLDEYSWQNLTWDGLNVRQEGLESFQILFEGINSPPLFWYSQNIEKVYCSITYVRENSGISVVNDGDPYREVVKFEDANNQGQIWIENSFFSQISGSIEFYAKSNDIDSQTWALSLFDNSDIGLKVLIEDNQWKFINGTSHIISECVTPVINQWHHVRLDFCTSGNYLNLSAHQFRLIIDNMSSNVYCFKDINQINKIRFESGSEDKGVAYIDAIGYTWDPEYNLGDNKYEVISYPEKINVQFSANCLDSESDSSSLRYYWNFDDETSGFGKNISHKYLSMGKYYVNLTVKDDNGATDWISKLILVHNSYPEVVDINCSDNTVVINEGETIVFNVDATDDESDLSRLDYYWNFESYDFNPYNFSGESGGWINTYLYDDDSNYSTYILVKDPDGAYGYRAIQITVQNVDPLLSIFDASIISNITFEVYRNSPSNNANFTFSLFSNEVPYMTRLLNFTGSQDNFVFSTKENIVMTLSKIWKIMINTTEVLPENSWFRCYVKLEFLDGYILILSSEKLYGGEFGHWEVDLNPYFFNNGDCTFMYPITFSSQIFDPSVDDIHLSIIYNISMLLRINCSDSLPISSSFELNNVNYTINVFEQGGLQFVNISAYQHVFSKSYLNNNFPVALDVNFTIYPIIDLYELLEIEMGLSGLIIHDCLNATNFITGFLMDDDGGQDTLTTTFYTTDNIIFDNLSPQINNYFPENGLVGQNITFYLDISDFDQISDQKDYYLANFKYIDTPSIPDDFDITNGSCEWNGELNFENDLYITFSGDHPATYSFVNDAIGSFPQEWTDLDSSDCESKVISELTGHTKLVQMYDNNPSGGFYIRNYFSSAQSVGTIEFWVRGDSTSTHDYLYMELWGSSRTCQVQWRLSEHKLYVFDGGWHSYYDTSFSKDKWFHMNVVFDKSANTLKWYCDGVYLGTTNYENSVDVDHIVFFSAWWTSNADFTWYLDAIGYSWDPNYSIGDNKNSILNFVSTFHIKNLDNDETLKYLKLEYAYKTDFSQQVNVSLFNFHDVSWELIDSTTIGTTIYKNKFSILNSKFINDTNEILVKVEGFGPCCNFFLDQFRLEYFSAKDSDNGQFTNEYEAQLPEDIDLLYGTLEMVQKHYHATYSFENNSIGSQPTDWIVSENPGCLISVKSFLGAHNKVVQMYDNNENEGFKMANYFFEAQSGGTIEFWVRGDSASTYDYLYMELWGSSRTFQAQWRLSEHKLYVFDGDWHSFYDASFSKDKWFHMKVVFDKSANTIRWYCDGIYLGTTNYENSVNIDHIVFFSAWWTSNADFTWYLDAIGYSWDLNYIVGDNLNYIYLPTGSEHNTFISDNGDIEFILSLQMEGIRPNDQITSVDLRYSLKTNISQEIDLSLYNYATSSYTIIDTSVYTSSENCTYSINNTDYYNEYFEVKLKIKGHNSTQPDYELYLNYLKLHYNWIKGIYQEDALYFNTPNPSTEINLINGTIESTGDLAEQDDEFCVFNSSSKILDFESEIFLTHLLAGDILNYLSLNYSFKTNFNQLIHISLYNFTAEDWVLINSANFLVFTNESFIIPLNRIETINGNETIEHHDFYNSNFKILVKIRGTNQSSNFQLFLDKLVVDYKFSPYSFRGNISISIDDGYYIEFDSGSETLQIDINMTSQYSTMCYTDINFDIPGTYLITATADDFISTATSGSVIVIQNSVPFAKISDFANSRLEDSKLSFTVDMSALGNLTNYRFFWLFGDGHFSNEISPTHSYAQSGVYNISLTITDCFGNLYTDIRNITILERKPEILGPFTFHGYEGQSVNLDVGIYDAFLDEIDMKYEWYDESLNLIANYKNPLVILDDGTYLYTLNVTDNSGLTASVNISIVIEDVPPVVLLSNYISYSGKVFENEGFIVGEVNGPGEIELSAYAYDSLDNDDLDYYWTITTGNISYYWNDLNSGFSSTAKFRATDTTLYRGQVKVVSAEKSMTSVFCINSFIDSNGNGFDDEFEARLLATNENISAFSDYDDDCYTDLYELAISNTSYLDPDSDGDGLYDGLDPLTGIGEQSARTDPHDWDCDNDILSDGIEVIGWQITTELFGEILVNSDPWNNDTDNDGVNDYDEYYKGSNPRSSDSDNDQLSDLLDPFPMKFDNDDDGLSDGVEYQLGTNMNNSDTDQDGISDGDEYLGWAFKTNPLSADSDHDFLADTAEMQNYHVAIEDRYDLNDPVSLQFETNCEKAAAAQVAFTLSFGEAINEPQNDKIYGIQTIPDLTVSVYKKDDNLLLYRNNTQGERYISQVVDIRELIENSGLDYRGEYIIKIDQTGTGAILEQFEVDITGYLNPNDADFDNDGIMDGVETGLLVQGYDTIDFKDSYMYDNLTVDDNLETNDEFCLAIPYIGRVYDADLYLKIISEGIPEGDGNISVQVIKEELNCNIDDAILVDYFSNFDNISSFTYETSIDLKNRLISKDITEYYGNYLLKIIIDEDSEIFSDFTLSEFYI
ncbi:MAG: PKD domain-containing protein, partial [Promethearchaeota archaeon]